MTTSATAVWPSGDQLALKQPIEVGSEERPPHPTTGICRRPVPSEWTTQIVLRKLWGAALASDKEQLFLEVVNASVTSVRSLRWPGRDSKLQ
jgi:hypothetical protein